MILFYLNVLGGSGFVFQHGVGWSLSVRRKLSSRVRGSKNHNLVEQVLWRIGFVRILQMRLMNFKFRELFNATLFD